MRRQTRYNDDTRGMMTVHYKNPSVAGQLDRRSFCIMLWLLLDTLMQMNELLHHIL